MIVMLGNVLSKVTSDASVVPVIVSPAFPKRSSKSIVKGMSQSVSVQSVVYVALQADQAPTTLATFPKIVALTQVRFSLPVNVSVMIFPDNARDHDALFDCILTPDNIGLTPNEVK
ncbi:hypothetical protein KKH82_04395 [Patescibacteria group bacterium]|nr:hypothetical protein [Patescibacteria group bacterium]